uniref:Uncharacterized protein n=1 Tax=Parascaris equorum TaxID=6256 RepID=A0A914S3I2_PAREQ
MKIDITVQLLICGNAKLSVIYVFGNVYFVSPTSYERRDLPSLRSSRTTNFSKIASENHIRESVIAVKDFF